MKPGRLRFKTTIVLSATNVAAAAVITAGTAMTLVGTAFGTDTEGTLTLTFAGADPATTRVLIKGTGWDGREVVEAVRGPAAAATVRTIKAFRTVTSINSNVTTVGTVSVGWANPTWSSLFPIDIPNMVAAVGWQLSYSTSATGSVGAQSTRVPVMSRRGYPDKNQQLNPSFYGTEFDLVSPWVDSSLASDFYDTAGFAIGTPLTANASGTFVGVVTAVRVGIATAVFGVIEARISVIGPYRTG